jgi:hypothetical protein
MNKQSWVVIMIYLHFCLSTDLQSIHTLTFNTYKHKKVISRKFMTLHSLLVALNVKLILRLFETNNGFYP